MSKKLQKGGVVRIWETLEAVSNDPELLEIGRKAIEDVLIDFRDSRIAVLRNNGCVCKEKDGSDSHIIRLGPEDALRIGLKAIAEHLAVAVH